MKKQTNIAVLGGGASGMMAAVTAAETLRKAGSGAGVLLLEGAPRVGKKLLATGNGRCNLSNRCIEEAQYRGDVSWASPILRQFPAKTVVRKFEKLGLLCREDSEGRIYPYSLQAASVLDILREQLSRLKVETQCEVPVTGVRKEGGGFLIESANGDTVSADRVILSLGGRAAPKLGGSGSGTEIAAALGHTVTEVFPALSPLRSEERRTKPLKGVRSRAAVSLLEDGVPVQKETGEVQFTEQGLSGICVFQMAGRCGQALSQGKTVELALDLMPEWELSSLTKQIAGQCRRFPERDGKDVLRGFLHQRVGQEVMKAAFHNAPPKTAGSCSYDNCGKIAETVKRFRFPIYGSTGWDSSQVTAGGVPGEETDASTMESRRCPGLYLTGELLNVDGLCGGLNLHWAWSTGILAGKACAEAVLKKEAKI